MSNKQVCLACLECGGKFRAGGAKNTSLDSIPGIELENELLSSGIERNFYRCPHCGFEYTVMITDEEIRKLMINRERLRGYANIKNKGVREQKRREFEKLDKEIKEKIDKLNK